jgi:hypothetical protein
MGTLVNRGPLTHALDFTSNWHIFSLFKTALIIIEAMPHFSFALGLKPTWSKHSTKFIFNCSTVICRNVFEIEFRSEIKFRS